MGRKRQASLFFRDQKICYIESTLCLYVFFWQRYGTRPKMQKHTTGGIPRWSPTLVLVARFSAYVWQSGRDAQFSLTYGRMCRFTRFFQFERFKMERPGHGSHGFRHGGEAGTHQHECRLSTNTNVSGSSVHVRVCRCSRMCSIVSV